MEEEPLGIKINVPSLEVESSILRHKEFPSSREGTSLEALIFQILEIYKEILCIAYF